MAAAPEHQCGPRVVSVLPSATEILCYIGGSHLLVGRSHEDNYPTNICHLPEVTGQKTTFTTSAEVNATVSASLGRGESLYLLDEALIKSLRPDVILTQDICKVCAIDLQTVERLAASLNPKPTVVSLNPLCFSDILENIEQVGKAVGMQRQAALARQNLERRLCAVDDLVAGSNPTQLNVAFIEWTDPLYVGGHWTPQLIVRAGASHPLNPPDEYGGGANKSFPAPSSTLVASAPDLIVFCPCGLDMDAIRREVKVLQRQDWWQSLSAVREGRVALVDGDAMFNRPGPRLVDALEWLVSAIHDRPDVMPNLFPVEWLKPGARDSGAAPSSDLCGSDLLAIEDAHRAAVLAGELHYSDPHTGYTVFTQLTAINRGYCCGSGCRHCPFKHKNVAADRRAQLRPPIVVAEQLASLQ